MQTTNQKLKDWVEQIANHCLPQDVYWCDGSPAEQDNLLKELVAKGTFKPVPARPNSYWVCSHPSDVARVEKRTFICSAREEDAGPTNNWMAPAQMKQILWPKFAGCMQGRRMYVIPFCMGPYDSPLAKIGVEITDSPYVVANMYLMARVGEKALAKLGNGDFIPCLHSVGAPLLPGQKDVAWPCEPDPENKYIVQFPEEATIWSYGSGYGGNALLGKKCLALRIASVLAKKEGWLAEHMLILALTNPQGKTFYMAAAFPSACGKTNLAMLKMPLPGWQVKCLGDDIAWLRPGPDGRLWAINPEYGFFGVAPGTSRKTNAQAMAAMEKNAIFTNVALADDGDVWWEGMDREITGAVDWQGQRWTPGCGHKAAHPNSRFTAPLTQCPILDPHWNDGAGVPLSAIIFGGRRPSTVPLVTEAFSWEHGVFFGSAIASETTAANLDQVGIVRRDPFAMRPFFGYHVCDYFQHWLSFKNLSHLPRIFMVNWFQKEGERFLWPGYADNGRVLKWITQRLENKVEGQKTPLGINPGLNELDLTNLNITESDLARLLTCDAPSWKKEAQSIAEFYQSLGPKVPPALWQQLTDLQKRLNADQRPSSSASCSL